MDSLYVIDERILEAYEKAVDPESGEILDEEALAELDKLQMEREQKIEGVCCWIKNLRSDAAALKAEEEALYARRKQKEAKMERLGRWILKALNGTKFETTKVKVSFRRTKSVEVDEDVLPEEFWRMKVERSADKVKLTEALKAGQEVAGAKLVQNLSMTIK